MNLSERLLLALSRDPAAPDYTVAHYEARHQRVEVAAENIRKLFPAECLAKLAGARVLDIGCADGLEPLALKQLGAAEVVGIDIRLPSPLPCLPPGVWLEVQDATRTGYAENSFDAVVTLTSLEHFSDPEAVLKESLRVLRPGGLVLLTSGIWYGPWGSHMHFFCRVPWLNVWFSERTIMSVRRHFRQDGASRYCECEGGLNDITLAKFERMVCRLGAELVLLKPSPLKGIKLFAKLPVAREFLCHGFTAVLRRP